MADARITCQLGDEGARGETQQTAPRSSLPSPTPNTTTTTAAAPVIGQPGSQDTASPHQTPTSSSPRPVPSAHNPRSLYTLPRDQPSNAAIPACKGARRLDPVLEKRFESSHISRQSSFNSLIQEAINDNHYNAPPLFPRSGNLPIRSAFRDRRHDEYANLILRSLIHLSFCAPLLSLGVCIYSIVVLVVTGFATIARKCFTPGGDHSRLISRCLLPPLNLQRRCIALPPLSLRPPRVADEGLSSEKSDYLSTISSNEASYVIRGCSPSRLMTTHVASPVVSLPLALVAMITTLYWSLSAMIANEQTGGEGDEERFAERIVEFWEAWLDWSVEI